MGKFRDFRCEVPVRGAICQEYSTVQRLQKPPKKPSHKTQPLRTQPAAQHMKRQNPRFRAANERVRLTAFLFRGFGGEGAYPDQTSGTRSR